MRRFILGLDEGTTSLKSVLYDADKKDIVDIESRSVTQHYPKLGWVEQNAEEIFKKVLSSAKSLLSKHAVKKEELLGIGITNQRESIVAWDRETGKPICKAIIWQCRRTTKEIEALPQEIKNKIKEKTGLIANPYFSASKMEWILNNIKEAKILEKQNRLCFGTIDSFLAFSLTGNHVTDTTNASRTMLMNLHTLQWDDDLLSIFGISKNSLPEIKACDSNFGNVKKLLNAPICSIIGDQMSSMYGQGAINYGNTKVTYGTGAFILSNIGSDASKNIPSLLTTVCSTLSGKTQYAVEGSIYSACRSLEWLKNLGIYDDTSKTDALAKSLTDNGGVYFVPAFTGLGAPYWNNNAKATIFGMTYNTSKAHFVRAALESWCYNTKAILDEMKKYGQKFKMISVDGGGSKNEFVLQFLADMLGHEVVKSKHSESTVLGTIYIAMLSLKLINLEEIKKISESNKKYMCQISTKKRETLYTGWQEALKQI